MNPFAAKHPKHPPPARPRRAPDHPPVLRRVHRLGLRVPQQVEAEMRRRWEGMDDAERWEAIAADQAFTDDELRALVAEMVDAIASATPEQLAELDRQMADD